MKVEVIALVEGPTKHTNGYSVKVIARNPMGNEFNYEFIKNKKEDADEIIVGYTWEFQSRRKWL